MPIQVLPARLPVVLEAPEAMLGPIAHVLNGEYECSYGGSGLTVLDLGANVGAFTLWADLRWPGSTIHAFEPHPNTFRMLQANVAHLPHVICHNAAVAPTGEASATLVSRFDGDGESSLAAYAKETFAETSGGSQYVVPVTHPRDLPACDVLKVDVEGAEADILEAMDVSVVSLLLLEYQFQASRDRILKRLNPTFDLIREDRFAWRDILGYAGYRPELADDHYGNLFLLKRGQAKLRALPSEFAPGGETPDAVADNLPFRSLVRAATRRLRSRLLGRAGDQSK